MTTDGAPAVALNRDGHDRLWEWFALSYASFLTLPRALMHEMPDDWQARMADLLKEYSAAFPFFENGGYGIHVSLRQGNRIVKAPRWLIEYRHPDVDAIRRFTR